MMLNILIIAYLIGCVLMFLSSILTFSSYKLTLSDVTISFGLAVTWPVSWYLLYKILKNS